MDANALVYGYNAEEYNPVTDMQYLRSRYYSPTSQSFTTQDTYTGSPYDIASANRYAYTQGDPVNNADATGHMIGTSSYERQMEQAGGINEIYDFYVGVTLQNSLIRATNSFYGSLQHARATDYRSQAAINSISLISQATANLYINQGSDAARSVGATYGCTPGALTNQAISSFANDVNTTKNSVNTQISAVKSQKQYQHQQYEAYLAYLAAQAAKAAQQNASGGGGGGGVYGHALLPAGDDGLMPAPPDGAGRLSFDADILLILARSAGYVSSSAVPGIGYLVDFGLQIATGEDFYDAGMKAAWHMGIGLVGDVVGAGIGALADGVGAPFGAVIGAGAAAVADAWFDVTVYDPYLRGH
jgi:RHS repeat-associated protein